jgi:hypothetical protein
MTVSASGRARATACCRSFVNVAIPQRRGSEFPIKATRIDGVTVEPPAVVDERPVGYENAQRRSAGIEAAEKAAESTAYSNWHDLLE